MSITINNVSLLLERFGNNSDYSIYLDFYSFENGADILTYAATSTKSAKDINNKSWYNFKFNNITISSDSVLFILRQDNFGEDNFITWVHSDVNSSTTSIYSNSYAFDTLSLSTDSNFTAYYSIYNQNLYSTNSISGYDFFTVFGFSKRQDFARCIKIYDEFNNITLTREDIRVELPGFVKQTKTWNNRQDWIGGQKSNVSILGDKLTLSPIPRRIGFLDRKESSGEVHQSNIGLPPSILSFDLYDGDDEFNCMAFAGSELDGLYKSTNSGASWTKVSSFAGNNITSIKFSSSGKIAVAGKYPTSNLYVSEDSGSTWTIIAVTSDDQVNDIVWQNDDIIYLATQTQGILKYIISTLTLSLFNQGLETPYPVCRKLFFENGFSRFEYGLGYGYAFSVIDFFNVFNVAGPSIGYSFTNLQEVRATTYGWEIYSSRRLMLASDYGIYSNDLTYDWFRVGEDDDIEDTYSVFSDEDLIYVGTDTGLALSTDGGVTFNANDQDDTIQVKGLLQRPVVQIDRNEDDALVYVAQNGALSASKSVFFQQVMNDKTFDNNILDIVVNPVNPDFIHILTQSNIGQNDYITFIVDNSSSLRFNDPNNKRKEIVEDVSDAVYSSNSKTRFQIIQFSGIDATAPGDLKDSFSGRGKAINLTDGFTLNNSSDVLQSSIDLIGLSTEVSQQTTPLIDTLNLSMQSILFGGLDWTYDAGDLQYTAIENRDDNSSIAEHVLVLVTDGKDVESLRSIKDFVNNTNFQNKIEIRAYVIVIGPDYNREVIYNLINFFDGSRLFFCNTDAHIDSAIEYISSQEAKNITEGSYRKTTLLNETMAEVYRMTLSARIPTGTRIKLRYRYSDNNDTLIDEPFTNWIKISDGENVIQIPSIQCKFFEYEVYLYKETTNKFPLISEISINYRIPTESIIVFDEKDYPTNRIGQIVVSRTITVDDENDKETYLHNYGLSLYGYGLGIGYVNPRNPNLYKAHENWFLIHSNAINPETGDPIRPEQPNYTRRRIKEKCSTNDFYNYEANRGGWSKDLTTTVYVGDSVQSESVYDLIPQDGIVRFHTEQSPSTVVTISLTQGSKRRLVQKINNTFERLTLKYKNVGVEFLDEQDTYTSRDALPAFASQSTSDNAVVLNSYNIISSNNNTITGQYLPDKSSVESTQGLRQISINTYLSVTFGELFEYLDSDLNKTGEFEILPHQENWIIGNIGNADSDENVISIISTESNVKLILNNVEDEDGGFEYAAFRVSGASGSITKSYGLTIGDTGRASNGFDFSIYQTSETGHLETHPNNSSISTYVWTGITGSLSSINPYLDHSSSPLRTSLTASNLGIRVVCQSVVKSSTTVAKIQIINSDGLQPNLFIGLIDISVEHFNFEGDDTSYPQSQSVSVLMNESDLNVISQTVTIQPGMNYVTATIQGTGISGVSNAILYDTQSSQENLYWGDLNTPSCLGIGRQSPAFIYQYARDISELDFCSVCDDYDKIESDKFNQIDRWSDYFNSNNQFVTFSGFRFVPYNFSSLNKNEGVRTYIFKDNLVDVLGETKPDIKTLNGLNERIANSNVYSMLQLTSYNFDTDVVGDKYGYNFAVNDNNVDALEVLSEHGSIEKMNLSTGLVSPQNNGTNHSFFVGALNFDHKISVIGNSNSITSRPGLYHSELTRESIFPPGNNRPITGAWTSSGLSRDSIFTALKNGRSFTTTGNRMFIDYNLTIGTVSYKMGEKNGTTSRESLTNVVINIKCATEADGRIEVYRFGNFNSNENSPTLVGTTNVFQDAPSSIYTVTDTFADTVIADLPNLLIYYVKAIQNDGHIGIGSPVYVSLET